MLLKASDRVIDDLNLMKSLASPCSELFLRKFEETNPNYEFRCFVSKGQLIGNSAFNFNFLFHFCSLAISQRNLDTFCELLFTESEKIRNIIVPFYTQNFDHFPVESCTKFCAIYVAVFNFSQIPLTYTLKIRLFL